MVSRLGDVLEKRPAVADSRPRWLQLRRARAPRRADGNDLRARTNGHIKAVFSRDLTTAGVCGSEDADIHQISNLQAGDADLVTLHIYSPPLVRMGTYSLTDATRGEELMAMEFGDAAGI